MQVFVIGAGPGRIDLLSGYAVEMIKQADLVLATERLHAKFKGLNANSIACPLSKIPEIIAGSRTRAAKIAVLVSGDVGFYSFADTLKRKLPDEELIFVNGFSSLQYLAAKRQVAYEQIKTVSVHGREKSVIPYVCYNEKVFVLTGGKYKAHHVIKELVTAGLGEVVVTVGENLADERERLVTATAQELQGMEFENLAVMLITNKNYVNVAVGLKDEDFSRARVPMTKAEIRNLSLAALNISPRDIVYDIGAGTGSVAIAMARRAYESFVYAIEKSPAAITLLEQNRRQLRAYNLKIIQAEAPAGLKDLPPPDKVFIGGSAGNLAAILDVIFAKNQFVRVVVNAVTLETLHEAVACFEDRGIEPEVIAVNIAKAKKTGSYRLLRAHNPVYIISGEYHEK